MEEIILQEEISQLMNKKGEVRGIALINESDFIIKEKGKEGLKKFEEAVARLGVTRGQKELNKWEFYPIWQEIIGLLVIKKTFNFSDEKMKEIGILGSKLSYIIKLFFQYYMGSMNSLAQKAPEMWRKYYTIGDLVVEEINEEKKYIIVDIKNFNFHPIHCLHLSGYFSNIVKLASDTKTIIDCQEIKCVHRGDEYHQFLIKW
ncbi:MAG: hypothetical protein WCW93_01795 [Candidatus Paceibacterota bacterium]